MTQIHCLLPELKNRIGHIYEYALSVKKAAEKNGWSQSASVCETCEIDQLPIGWKKNLPASFTINLYSAYRQAMNQENDILFLEHFRLFHLITLFLTYFFSRHRPHLWLLHRHSPREMKLGGRLHSLLYRAFERLLGPGKLQFMTDSELLRQQQEALFKRKIHLLPIPHTHTDTKNQFPKPQTTIDCWWPGGATRNAKGLRDICKISEELNRNKGPLRLIVAKNAEAKGVKGSSSVLFIEDELTRSDYEAWLQSADLVLLPYHPSVYHCATSGIFVEAICAGSIPVTKDHTWMAFELRRYDLSELIFDWEDSALLKNLASLPQNMMIQKKLETMREDYKQFHSIEEFAKSFQTIFKSS